jgi:hypothetical protein
MGRIMRGRAAIGAGLAAVLLLGLLPVPAGAEEPVTPPLIDLIKVDNGTTDSFGGGNQLTVRTGNQAFGVVYGGRGDAAGYVTFYGAVVRTLGTADVYEAGSGRLVREDVPLPVITVVAQRTVGIVEFRDTVGRPGGGGDGIFNYRPNLTTPELLDFNASEPLLKGLLLDGTWSLTGFALEADGHDAVAVAFSLTLANATYTAPGPAEWSGDGLVQAVAFHVHLTVTRTVETLEGVPHYNASVARTRNGRELTTITPDGTTTTTATVTRAHFKVDHEVVGWDVAPKRDVPSRLLLITAIPVVTGIPDAIAPWINDLALRGERTVYARAEVPEGEPVDINGSGRPVDTFTRADAVELRDGWRQSGRLAFEPTVSVWSNPEQVEPEAGKAFFQVLGGAPIAERVDKMALRGFLLIAGFSYPAGHRVFHDPEVIAEGVEIAGDPSLPAFQSTAAMAGQVAAVSGAVVGAVALAAYLASSRARARRARDAERFEALRQLYQLPPGGGLP